jgi:hypothetical protein
MSPVLWIVTALLPVLFAKMPRATPPVAIVARGPVLLSMVTAPLPVKRIPSTPGAGAIFAVRPLMLSTE